MTSDPRIAAVENNLLAFLGKMAGLDVFRRLPADDVVAYTSDLPFPLFNGVIGAAFPPGHEAERTREVTSEYLRRGLPFLWWTTPSTCTPAMTEVFDEVGMECERIPGMHVSLGSFVVAPEPGVRVDVAGEHDVPSLVDTMMAGFGFPELVAAPMTRLFHALPGPDLINVLAVVDGGPVGCGSAYVTEDIVGLYNITTLERFRGRGVGYAVTAALMELGRQRGATQAVLHASQEGRPVYERLGFVEVCLVPQYVWVPPA